CRSSAPAPAAAGRPAGRRRGRPPPRAAAAPARPADRRPGPPGRRPWPAAAPAPGWRAAAARPARRRGGSRRGGAARAGGSWRLLSQVLRQQLGERRRGAGRGVGQRLVEGVQGAGAAGADPEQQLGAAHVDHDQAVARPEEAGLGQRTEPGGGGGADRGLSVRWDGLTMSVRRTPKRSLTTTTSPWAIRVPWTYTSSGSPALRARATTEPWLSWSRLRIGIRARPTSSDSETGTSRMTSRLRSAPACPASAVS